MVKSWMRNGWHFLADPGTPKGQAAQMTIHQNVAFQSDDLDAYDLDCDDVSTAKAVMMANLSSLSSDVLSEVPIIQAYQPELSNDYVQEMQYSEEPLIVESTDIEINSDSNIIPYSQYLLETQSAGLQDTNSSEQHNLLIMSLVEQMNLKADLDKYNQQTQHLSKHIKEKDSLSNKLIVLKTEFKERDSRNDNKEIALEKKIKEQENIIFKQFNSIQALHMLTTPQAYFDNVNKQALGYQNPFFLKRAQRIQPNLYDGSVIAKKHDMISVVDDEETLIFDALCRVVVTGEVQVRICRIFLIGYGVLVVRDRIFKCLRLSSKLRAFELNLHQVLQQAFWAKHSNSVSETPTKSHKTVRIEAPSELP
ncbi:hypothetical protein Tco_0212596 [Tanacetum coccineum]